MTKFLPCRKLLLPPALEEVLRNDATHLATEQKCLRLRPEMASDPGWHHPSFMQLLKPSLQVETKDFQKHCGFNK